MTTLAQNVLGPGKGVAIVTRENGDRLKPGARTTFVALLAFHVGGKWKF
jgi:hypothetical protein